LNQISIFKNEAGILCGYATWAFVAEDTEQRLIQDPQVLLHFSEWNEGDRLWILDLLCVHGDVRSLIRELFKQFPKVNEAKSLRRREDGSIRKIVTWRRHCY
jgi:hemolysin-activating ACP:hemolysin acyltransferase